MTEASRWRFVAGPVRSRMGRPKIWLDRCPLTRGASREDDFHGIFGTTFYSEHEGICGREHLGHGIRNGGKYRSANTDRDGMLLIFGGILHAFSHALEHLGSLAILLAGTVSRGDGGLAPSPHLRPPF